MGKGPRHPWEVSLAMVGMTNVLSSIGYPHWLMIAGSLLVVLGIVGLLMLRESVQAEPDAIAGEREIFKIEGDLAQADVTDPPVKKKRRDRWAERELKEESNDGPELYGKRS